MQRLRHLAISEVVRDWEHENGALTEEEIAEADRILDRAKSLAPAPTQIAARA
jgi:hypothetical protein